MLIRKLDKNVGRKKFLFGSIKTFVKTVTINVRSFINILKFASPCIIIQFK